MRKNILVFNPGSTSTKISFYDGLKEVYTKNCSHSKEEVEACSTWLEQVPFRAQALRDFMDEFGIKKEDVDLIVPRYTAGNNVSYPGHYSANQELIDYIKSGENHFHIMSITPLIPYEVFGLDVPMVICNNDALLDIDPALTMTGIPEIKRSVTKCHMENMIAITAKIAAEQGKQSSDMNLVIAHMGGGVSFAWIKNGKFGYTMFDGEACYSPERGGNIPALPLIDMCYSGQYTKQQMVKKIKGAGGLAAHFGTNDAVEIENRAIAGDEQAKLVYDGMCIRAAACIGECAAIAGGKIDAIVLTGGLARAKYVTDIISEHVSWIAPVIIIGGEIEMESFSSFGTSYLDGEADVQPFDVSKVVVK